MVNLSTISFAVRASSKVKNIPVPLNQLQQLVSAYLGFKSLAAYQTSLDVKDFPVSEQTHFVLDEKLYGQRFQELNLTAPSQEIGELIQRQFKESLPNAHFHQNNNALDDYIRNQIEQIAYNNSQVTSQMAMTNTDGVDEIYLPFDDMTFQNLTVGEVELVEIQGHIKLTPDTERPFSGDTVDIEMTVSLESGGRVWWLEPEIEVINAELDYGWGDDDRILPQMSLVEALAEEFDLTLSEAGELTDAEVAEDASDDGVIYRLLFDFEDHASPLLAAKLIKNFGSLKLGVAPWFFDNVKRDI